MNRELLEKPFEPGQVKQRVGTYGSVQTQAGMEDIVMAKKK